MYPCLGLFLKYDTNLPSETSLRAWAGEVEESIKGGVVTMTHLTVSWLLNKTVSLLGQLTFHTSAAPSRELGCEQSVLGWVERSSSREVAVNVDFFFLFNTVFPSLWVHLPRERVKERWRVGSIFSGASPGGSTTLWYQFWRLNCIDSAVILSAPCIHSATKFFY